MQPLSCFCFSVKSHHLSTSFPAIGCYFQLIQFWDKREKHSSKTSQWVNLPGKLHRQQFVIQECEKCNMYVFNHSKTITINDCVISRIFLRLVKGSVFVRDCKHTKCVVMKVFLCCFYYPELAYHFKDAGLSMFNNNWSYIHHLILVSRRNNCNHESEFKMVHENSEQSCLFVCFAGEYGTSIKEIPDNCWVDCEHIWVSTCDNQSRKVYDNMGLILVFKGVVLILENTLY
uniref:RP2 activator of ARL3 GTPase n=1 Tax=Acanthochromis polyacanthus TaxID=80966 RepID=A0A3Q1GAL4_9TELE